jgi:hypothetical protein
MYKIRVRYNYLYKLIEELYTQLPNAKFQVKNDTLITFDHQVVDFAKYVYQFQPELLVIKHSLSPSVETEAKEISSEKLLAFVC